MTDRVVAAGAGLEELGDVPIDLVLTTMDEEVPGYRQLYYLWERQHWEAGTIDFSGDRRQWTEDLSPELRRSLLWMLASFSVGEEHVTKNLVPFVDAAPSEEQAVFLTTQLADGARHNIFIDRFYSEVVRERGGNTKAHAEHRSERLNPSFRTLLIEMLPEAAGRIRREKEGVAALIEGVVLYHIVIEGCVALTTQRFLLDYMRKLGLLTGFRQGSTAVARDQARHVTFAVRFLKDMVERDRDNAQVIQGMIARALPVALSALDPPDGDLEIFEPFAFGPDDLAVFAREWLGHRVRAIGDELSA